MTNIIEFPSKDDLIVISPQLICGIDTVGCSAHTKDGNHCKSRHGLAEIDCNDYGLHIVCSVHLRMLEKHNDIEVCCLSREMCDEN